MIILSRSNRTVLGYYDLLSEYSYFSASSNNKPYKYGSWTGKIKLYDDGYAVGLMRDDKNYGPPTHLLIGTFVPEKGIQMAKIEIESNEYPPFIFEAIASKDEPNKLAGTSETYFGKTTGTIIVEARPVKFMNAVQIKLDELIEIALNKVLAQENMTVNECLDLFVNKIPQHQMAEYLNNKYYNSNNILSEYQDINPLYVESEIVENLDVPESWLNDPEIAEWIESTKQSIDQVISEKISGKSSGQSTYE